jgi:hypothetical protein
MYDGVFFINHALKVNQLSVYSEEERFKQTLQTIESIDAKCPNNAKFMFDSSPMCPNREYISELSDRGVSILWCGAEPNVQKFSNAGLRSLSECISFMMFLDWFEKQNVQAKRIYKLSGRYRLTDNFVLDDSSYKDAFVFSESLPSWMTPERIQQTKADKLFRLRLWHMDFSMLDIFREKLPIIFNDCRYNGIDVEHSYYKNLRLYNTVEVKKIGVCGNIAPNGEFIDD